MKDITQLHNELRRKYQEGTLDIAGMLEIQEERKTENAYAAKLGMRQPIGLDGAPGGAVDPNNTVIGFFVGRDVLFLGDQAVKVKSLIESYADRLRFSQENMEGSDRQTLARVNNNRLKLTKVKAGHNGSEIETDQLTLWGSHWNDWLTAIYRTGHAFMAFSIEEGC